MRWSYGWSVLALVSAAWAVNFLSRWVIPPLIPTIQNNYEIGPAIAGLAFSVLWIGYGIMQVVAGALGDRFGAKAVLAPGMLSLSFGMLLVGFSPSLLFIFIAFLFVGIGGGCVFSVSTALIAQVFPQGNSKPLAVFFSVGTSGAAISPILALAIMNWLSWKWVFMFYALPSLVLAVSISRLIKSGKVERGHAAPKRRGIPKLGKSVLAMAIGSSIFGYAWNGVLTFLPSLLTERGVANEVVSTSYSLTFAAGIVMLFAGGWLTNKISTYNLIIALTILAGISCEAIITVKDTFLILILALPLGIALHGFWGPSMTALLNLAPVENRGTVVGTASSMISLIEGTSPALVGYLAERTSLLLAMQALVAIFFASIPPLLLTRKLGERILAGSGMGKS